MSRNLSSGQVEAKLANMLTVEPKNFEKDNCMAGLDGCRPVYDGRKNIFALKILPFGETATFDASSVNAIRNVTVGRSFSFRMIQYRFLVVLKFGKDSNNRATAYYEAGPLIQMAIKLLGKETRTIVVAASNEKELIKVEKAIKNLKSFPIQFIQAFIRELAITCREADLQIPNRSPPIMRATPQGDIESVLKQAWLRAGNACSTAINCLHITHH
ncbi:5626_t:CDS:2 [Ambispora leptoticha]|uniref:5626_t:CDS:1 n=1 Tax=Ambispora leptoticha TaxID=144679 RepID=A0A9N8ZMP5_9GLOM|nr:5626_t:CDS:2 [Ambispora leptoticha]